MSAPKHTAGLDTSGEVVALQCGGLNTPASPGVWRWSDLSPFTQGYIEALFASVDGFARIDLDRPGQWAFKGFSDLAPETLARIIADCEAWTANRKAVVEYPGEGAALWAVRQCGGLKGFPPLTVQLGDDGKVRFAKATGEGS